MEAIYGSVEMGRYDRGNVVNGPEVCLIHWYLRYTISLKLSYLVSFPCEHERNRKNRGLSAENSILMVETPI